MIRNPVEIFLISHFVCPLSNDCKCQLMTSFCLQIIRILYEKKLYLIFGRLLFQETFQLSRINAISIVSSTDLTFRTAFHLKERSLTLFPFDQPSILSRIFCKQNDVISQSYKLVDNSKMKQSIK